MKIIYIGLIIVVLGIGANAGSKKVFVEEPQHLKKFIPIVRLVGSNDNNGNYNFDSESSDGTKFVETGGVKIVKGEIGAIKSGEFSWISPEGEHFSMSYTADEFGFHPMGSHLPTSPPIPIEIARILPSLPKLIEMDYETEIIKTFKTPVVPQPHVHVRKNHQRIHTPHQHHSDTILIQSKPLLELNRFEKTVSVRQSPVPLPLPAQVPVDVKLETHIETPEYTIHSKPGKTFVRIGNQ